MEEAMGVGARVEEVMGVSGRVEEAQGAQGKASRNRRIGEFGRQTPGCAEYAPYV